MMINPYIYDRPLTRGEHSYQRPELLQVAARIASAHPQSLSIVGEPRTGKTSLLHWLAHEASRADYLDDPASYVVLLLSLKEQPPAHPKAFFARIGEALAQTGHGGMLPSMEGFRQMVEQVQEEQKKLVLFLDDFEAVTTNRAFPPDVFAFLRSIANTHDVAYVTTSVADLQTLCASPALEDSPFFNIFTPVTLQPFSEEEATQFVRDRAIAAGAPFVTEVEWILRLAGGHPYLLQLTAHVAWDARATGQVTQEVVTGQTVEAAKGFLQHLWDDRFTPPQREVLQMLGGRKAVQSQSRYAADELADRGYLQRIGERYVISSLLLEVFVQGMRGGKFWKRLLGW